MEKFGLQNWNDRLLNISSGIVDESLQLKLREFKTEIKECKDEMRLICTPYHIYSRNVEKENIFSGILEQLHTC